jgi:hypothetical protein
VNVGHWIGVVAIVVALGSATIALSSRRVAAQSRDIASDSRDEAVAANHRADTPAVKVSCDGLLGTSFGLVVTFETNKDLDAMRVELTETYADGRRGGFNGIWVDQVVNSPMQVTFGEHGIVTFGGVRAGLPCVLVVRKHGDRIPKEAQIKFRLTCRAGERPPWVVPVDSGPLQIRYS